MFHVIVFLMLSGRLVAAALKTIAIDDTYGDAVTGALPVYNPSAAWKKCQACVLNDCLVNPDAKQVWNGTWHDPVGIDDNAPRTIDLSFEGNSISVYCVISQENRKEITVTNMTFELDGQKAGEFCHNPDGGVDAAGNYQFLYNVSVFDSGSIPRGKHTLRINLIGYSRMLFDYALYSTDSDLANATSVPPSLVGFEALAADNTASYAPQPSSALSIAAIVGAAIGGSIGLIAISLLAFRLIRRRWRGSSVGSAHCIGGLSSGSRIPYGKNDADTRSLVSSTESVTFDRPPTPFLPYGHSHQSQTGGSRSREDLERQSIINLANSPTDSIPLIEFPTPPSLGELSPPRIVVTGTETHLIGPDNSMARFARQRAAEREAELTRRMGKTEVALTAKYGVSAAEAAPSTGSGTEPPRGFQPPSSSGPSPSRSPSVAAR